MNIHLVEAVLETPSQPNIEALLDDEESVFWVDWRGEDEAIVEACEAVLQTNKLAAEVVDIDTDEGYELRLQFGQRRMLVPLTYSDADRHLTLCALNDILRPRFEVRLCIDSHGSDTLAFLPLSGDDWKALETKFGDAVAKRFYALAHRPNVFTDALPF